MDVGGGEWLTEPPLGLVAVHGEFISGDRVEEEVVDDTVMRRVETGDDGVMIGKSEGWEDRDQTVLGFGAV
ncbi:hypothetical protein Lal_00045668 [Lupinus albus]|nr:hypothetical protein Lal_00045668 [Lupinus albus]